MRRPDMSRCTTSLATLMVGGLLLAGCGSTSDSAVAGRTSSGAATSAAAPSAGAGSATLDYTPPAGKSPAVVHKTVTGPAYQRLKADLDALKPVAPGSAQCNVLNGESGTITVTNSGHTMVWVVPGSPCRGVRLTTDGQDQPQLAGSVTLVNQIRAIAGTSGMAHALAPS